jgi:hypothetical protein
MRRKDRTAANPEGTLGRSRCNRGQPPGFYCHSNQGRTVAKNVAGGPVPKPSATRPQVDALRFPREIQGIRKQSATSVDTLHDCVSERNRLPGGARGEWVPEKPLRQVCSPSGRGSSSGLPLRGLVSADRYLGRNTPCKRGHGPISTAFRPFFRAQIALDTRRPFCETPRLLSRWISVFSPTGRFVWQAGRFSDMRRGFPT